MEILLGGELRRSVKLAPLKVGTGRSAVKGAIWFRQADAICYLAPPVRRAILASLLVLPICVACQSRRSENSRAKERIFSRQVVTPPNPANDPLAVDRLASDAAVQDRVLEMPETEVFGRLHGFRLRGKLTMTFAGSGQRQSLTEERLALRAENGDLQLRLEDSNARGIEILVVGGRSYGRSRYGPFFLRDADSDLDAQREDIFGALRTLYLESDRAWALHDLGPSAESGKDPCRKFQISLGAPRPAKRPERFSGRMDPDTARRSQFAYGKRLEAVSGELCVAEGSGVVIDAQVSLRWAATGDAGAGEVRVELTQRIDRAGIPRELKAPSEVEPVPHRPRGPASTLSRFGFGPERGDAGPPQPKN
jgi:hypothetical protein